MKMKLVTFTILFLVSITLLIQNSADAKDDITFSDVVRTWRIIDGLPGNDTFEITADGVIKAIVMEFTAYGSCFNSGYSGIAIFEDIRVNQGNFSFSDSYEENNSMVTTVNVLLDIWEATIEGTVISDSEISGTWNMNHSMLDDASRFKCQDTSSGKWRAIKTDYVSNITPIKLGQSFDAVLLKLDRPSGNNIFDLYSFKGFEGQEVTISASSREIDLLVALLSTTAKDAIVEDADKTPMDLDLDVNESKINISVALPRTEEYWIMVTSLDKGDTGRYTISLGGTDSHFKWKFNTGRDVNSSPAIGLDGTIYVGSNDFYLYALNPDVTKKWEFKTGDLVFSSPAIGSDGTIYVGSHDYSLYALNPDGTKKWEFRTADKVDSSPAIGADGTIYVGSRDNYLYAVNPNGTQKWKFETGKDVVFSSPAIGSDGTIYVGSWDDCLYAVNPDGTQKWKFKTGSDVISSPAIGSDGTIYVGSWDFCLYAVNPDGTQKWKFKTGESIRSSPAIGSDSTIYVGSEDDHLYAVNPDGMLKWKFKTGGDVYSSPAIGSDGTIYVGSKDNYLYALNPDGTQRWTFKAGDEVWSPPAIGSDGTIYVGSRENCLYALNSDSIGLADSPWPKFHHDNQNTGRVPMGDYPDIAQITVSPGTISFGEVTVGEVATATISIGNAGSNSLNVTDITSTLGEILIISEISFTVAPGAKQDITLTLTSSSEGEISGTLTINSDDANSPTAIPVTGKIVQTGIKGDVNRDGKIRSNDAILALRIAAGLMTPTDDQKLAADMNNDGKIRSNDAILILRKATGLAAPSRDVLSDAGGIFTVTLGEEAHGVAGGSVTVPLKVDSIDGLAGGDIRIAYDNAVLRAVDVSSNANVLLASNIAEPGTVRVTFASADGLKSKTVAEVQFEILADDISPLTLQEVELYRSDALLVDSKKTDSQFTSWAIPPEHSALLQNFPNPFNPDTWIPYQLREGSEVTIRIYNVAGYLVRELELGHKPAGLYVSKDRAAHWDGRNNLGIPVASGVYFYSIKAGDFTNVRKLIVLK